MGRGRSIARVHDGKGVYGYYGDGLIHDGHLRHRYLWLGGILTAGEKDSGNEGAAFNDGLRWTELLNNLVGTLSSLVVGRASYVGIVLRCPTGRLLRRRAQHRPPIQLRQTCGVGKGSARGASTFET